MTEFDIILNSKPYLLYFNYDYYPEYFEKFGNEFIPLIKDINPDEYTEHIHRLIDEINNYLLSLSRREQKKEVDEIKQVLALFAVPALLKADDNFCKYANELNSTWNSKFPKNHFIVGTYDAIMKGFDANLLGLPLRKSNRFKK